MTDHARPRLRNDMNPAGMPDECTPGPTDHAEPRLTREEVEAFEQDCTVRIAVPSVCAERIARELLRAWDERAAARELAGNIRTLVEQHMRITEQPDGVKSWSWQGNPRWLLAQIDALVLS